MLLPPPAPRAEELLTQHHCRDLDIPVIPAHLAILTQRLDAARIARTLWPGNALAQRVTEESMAARAACFYATPCGRGCSIKANFQTPTVLLPPALATGNLDIITDAMVREVTIDARGRATGVHYIDRNTRLDEHAGARVVVLAASACESARILLNSKSSLHPDGLGNGSGLVGKYVMDTVGPASAARPRSGEHAPAQRGRPSAMHLYMPWWLYQEHARPTRLRPRIPHRVRRRPAHARIRFMGGLAELTGGSYGSG